MLLEELYRKELQLTLQHMGHHDISQSADARVYKEWHLTAHLVAHNTTHIVVHTAISRPRAHPSTSRLLLSHIQ